MTIRAAHEDSGEECRERKRRKKSGELGRAWLLSRECKWKRIYAALWGMESVVTWHARLSHLLDNGGRRRFAIDVTFSLFLFTPEFVFSALSLFLCENPSSTIWGEAFPQVHKPFYEILQSKDKSAYSFHICHHYI